jgi:hypothetical protein
MCEETVEGIGDGVGIPQYGGIRPCNEVAGEDVDVSKIRQKMFTGNTTETVYFEDEAGNT